jgi:Flp pilus assembly pilin Flp
MEIVLRLIRNREGSGAIEYAIIAALMSVSALGALQALAAHPTDPYSTAP